MVFIAAPVSRRCPQRVQRPRMRDQHSMETYSVDGDLKTQAPPTESDYFPGPEKVGELYTNGVQDQDMCSLKRVVCYKRRL